MWRLPIVLVLGTIISVESTIWSCSQNSDCAFTEGAVCLNNNCVCPAGQQSVLGGTVCANWAPYYYSTCLDDFQCHGLVTNYHCRRIAGSLEGNCFCRDGAHYLFGRCWASSNYGQTCSRDEDCMGVLRDPFSLSCDVETSICGCAPGYYRRQRGECRKSGNAPGQECVIDEDCQFDHGACNIFTFTCYDSSVPEDTAAKTKNNDDLLRHIITKATSIQNRTGTKQVVPITQDGVARQHGAPCGPNNACSSPFVCSAVGGCSCPAGYYSIDGENACYAELGSPSTEEQCIGMMAEVRDGICTCQTNFYYNENMRDCVKVVRLITDSCLSDDACHTFGGAVRCGEPTGQWQLRSCECVTEYAVWDQGRSMCRLFAGIGEACQDSSDCMAGNLEIECVLNEQGDEGICTCPEGTSAQDGLCLTTGLDLGEACQVSQECSATENSGCYDGFCRCSSSYLEMDGDCLPTIGGNCVADTDCLAMDNLICVNNEDTGGSTCQCDSGFVEYEGQCWEPISDADSACEVTVQCTAVMGEFSACRDERCVCADNAHFRDDRCWPQTALFSACSRTSECFLQDISERVVCRNSMCQCSFEYPYSEELHTCTGSATTIFGSVLSVLLAVYLVLSH